MYSVQFLRPPSYENTKSTFYCQFVQNEDYGDTVESPIGIGARLLPNKHGLIEKHDYILIYFEEKVGGSQINHCLKAEKNGDTQKGEGDTGICLSLVSPDAERRSQARYETRIEDLGSGQEAWTMASVNHDSRRSRPFLPFAGCKLLEVRL
uniref:Uncharacterized protein n=1 Tax=Physcomitrium patens TaxID=3218 RepID=A0A2K1JBE8_PHYPA|nr:hypothetical protein PHYPA_019140 [Physcomitrium patens]